MDEKITQKNICGLGIFLIQERLCIIDPGNLQDQSNYRCGKREGQVKKRHKEITVLYIQRVIYAKIWCPQMSSMKPASKKLYRQVCVGKEILFQNRD